MSISPDPKPEPLPQRACPPHNPGLRKLIDGKRKWHRPERSSFLGWHERGYLPHFDAPYVTQFVTFMLRDAFPVARRPEWEGILTEPPQA